MFNLYTMLRRPLPLTTYTPPLRTPYQSKCLRQHHRYSQSSPPASPSKRFSTSATEAAVTVVTSPVFLSTSRAHLKHNRFHVSYLSPARLVIVVFLLFVYTIIVLYAALLQWRVRGRLSDLCDWVVRLTIILPLLSPLITTVATRPTYDIVSRTFDEQRSIRIKYNI